MRSIYCLLASLCFIQQLHAETFEEYKLHVTGEYQEYKDARDKEFVAFLKKQWSEFQGFKGVAMYQEPKPKTIPVVKTKITPTKGKEPARIAAEPTKPAIPLPSTIVATTPQLAPPAAELPRPVLPLSPPDVTSPQLLSPPIDPSKKISLIDFYGVTAYIQYDPNIRQSLASLNQVGMSAYWSELSKTDYAPLLAQLKSDQEKLKLNDWGTFILIDKFARSIHPDQDNEAVLLSWFLLSKLGYDSKVGYNEKHVYLMVAISHMVYQTAFFKEDRKTYYCLSNKGRLSDVGKLYSFKGNYPDANRELNFTIRENPSLSEDVKKRPLSFRYNNERYDITAQYAPALISYYQHYPQSAYPIYFDAHITDSPMSSLLSQLSPLLKGKSELEAVNILLRFVQTAFPYQTDEQQFSYEKVMLPEETLFYPYSDCEDRAILFAFLTRHLLGLSVVALHYPGHLATAVAFSTRVEGDTFSFKGKEYTVADPTYINANAGMTMPQYKNSQYQIIEM